MNRPLCTATCFVVCAVLVSPVASAVALDRADIVLGFGERYKAPDGSVATHRGVDVAMAPGTFVESPVSGQVVFAGRVPGPAGTSVLAVSIECAQGRVSVMPLDRLDVASGQSIAGGDDLGPVAEAGDPSSPGSHAHVSLRVGDLYVDPAALLAAPAQPAPPGDPQTAPENAAAAPVPAPAAQQSAGAATHPSPRTEGAQLAPGVVLAPAAAPVAAIAPAVSPPHPAVGSPAGAAVLSPGVSVAPGAGVRAEGAPPRSSLWSMPKLDARAVAPAVAAAAALGWGLFVLLTRRAVRTRVISMQPVSDRLGTMLQHMRTGDTICGLTSCSGLSAFTVPEPFSPEEVTK